MSDPQPASPPPPPPPPASPPPPPPPPAAHVDPPPRRNVVDPDDLIATTRAEAAAQRVENRNLREQIEREQADKLRIQQEADQRVAEAQAAERVRADKFRARTIDAEMRAAATAAGLADPDLMPLIDRSGIQVDDDGNVTGVVEAVDAFKAKKPDYFRPPASAAPAPTRTGVAPSVPSPSATPTTPTNVVTMPKADYEAAKRDGIRALRGQR